MRLCAPWLVFSDHNSRSQQDTQAHVADPASAFPDSSCDSHLPEEHIHTRASLPGSSGRPFSNCILNTHRHPRQRVASLYHPPAHTLSAHHGLLASTTHPVHAHSPPADPRTVPATRPALVPQLRPDSSCALVCVRHPLARRTTATPPRAHPSMHPLRAPLPVHDDRAAAQARLPPRAPARGVAAHPQLHRRPADARARRPREPVLERAHPGRLPVEGDVRAPRLFARRGRSGELPPRAGARRTAKKLARLVRQAPAGR